MRLQQGKEGADFAKIYETGKDTLKDGVLIDAVSSTRGGGVAGGGGRGRRGCRVGGMGVGALHGRARGEVCGGGRVWRRSIMRSSLTKDDGGR